MGVSYEYSIGMYFDCINCILDGWIYTILVCFVLLS